MAYELWNLESGNMIGDFSTEEAALVEVHAVVRSHGAVTVAAWALAYEDDDGETHPIAEGAVLAQRAAAVAPPGERTIRR